MKLLMRMTRMIKKEVLVHHPDYIVQDLTLAHEDCTLAPVRVLSLSIKKQQQVSLLQLGVVDEDQDLILNQDPQVDQVAVLTVVVLLEDVVVPRQLVEVKELWCVPI